MRLTRCWLTGWRCGHGEKPEDRYRACVEQGLAIVAFVSEQLAQAQRSIFDIDVLACPGLFGPHDRDEVHRDLERYRAKLHDPRTHATRLRLRLPGQFGGTQDVDTLLVSDVQNPDDPHRVLFFKDWARTDRLLAAERTGFVVLSVFMSRSIGGRSRCLVSVRPAMVSVCADLVHCSTRPRPSVRGELYGVDDRGVNTETGRLQACESRLFQH